MVTEESLIDVALLFSPAMDELPLLVLQNISCTLEQGQSLFRDVNLTLNEGDILVLQGKSGSGKSTLLKCIAHLVLHSGRTLYHGKTAQEQGIPYYRTRVMYVPQRPSLLPGTPTDFIHSILSLGTHRALARNNAEAEVMRRSSELAQVWDLDPDLWQREWSNLSGGEAQRMLLVIALSLNAAEILLLDEPTSALDPETSRLVEKVLTDEIASGGTLKALLWITHSAEQGKRVGTRFIQLAASGCCEESRSLV